MRIRVDGVLEVPGGTPANATMRKVLETGIAIGLREAIADGGFEGVRIEDLTVTILYSMVTRFQQPAIQRPVPSVVFGGVTGAGAGAPPDPSPVKPDETATAR